MKIRINASSQVQRIFACEIHDCLRGYSGNIRGANKAREMHWLPGDQYSGLEIFHTYLKSCNKPAPDLHLCKVGLTAPGTIRGIVPPLDVLDNDRGGLSERRCREVLGQVERLEQAVCVFQWFFDTSGLDTANQLSSLERWMEEPVPGTTWELLTLYRGLNDGFAVECARLALAALDSSSKEIQRLGARILARLSVFRDDPLPVTLIAEMLKQGIFSPAIVYRDAGDLIAAQLVKLLPRTTENAFDVDSYLSALAWTRSSLAAREFGKGHIEVDSDSGLRQFPVLDYAQEAGWTCEQNGAIRYLTRHQGCRLLPGDRDADSDKGRPVSCLVKQTDICTACGEALVCLFDFRQVLDSPLAPGNLPDKIITCLHCSLSEPVSVVYGDEEIRQVAADIVPDDIVDWELEFESMVLQFEDRSLPYLAATQLLDDRELTLLGGAPAWIQDADYPLCASCQQPMPYLAQFDMDLMEEDGLLYVFYCSDCQCSQVNFQQT